MQTPAELVKAIAADMDIEANPGKVPTEAKVKAACLRLSGKGRVYRFDSPDGSAFGLKSHSA